MTTIEDLQSRQFISDRDFAARYGMHVGVARHWAHAGLVAHIRLGKGSGYLLDLREAEALILEGFSEAGVPEDIGRHKSSPIHEFIQRWTCPAEGHEMSSRLYGAYRDWCDAVGKEPVTAHKFGRITNALGFKTFKANGRTYKTGIRLLTPEEIAGRGADGEPSVKPGMAG